ncbi:MAG: hypothetical protein COU69_00590 [Candidatus Pacebacteria bacterium CG10_big_fil_rev_8_21_14_0_10_56_10]|nr:MAG: hypothetical protein COU69_00590 [Candidatus Pacebacteria bacterium CG10_big_fil_rev_8_21_14_0_10_56_10]
MNNSTSSLYLETLDEKQRAIFDLFPRLPKHWYLGGGTALAIQLGHRISFDFDFFSQQNIHTSFRRELLNLFGEELHFSMDTDEQITFFTSGQVKLTFATTPYKPLYPLVETHTLQLENIQDIAADKAFTIGRRGAFRDYVDLYFLLAGQASLEKVTTDAQRKYKGMFDEKLFLEQLDYMGDITDFSIELIDAKLSQDEVHQLLHEKIRGYLRKKKLIP